MVEITEAMVEAAKRAYLKSAEVEKLAEMVDPWLTPAIRAALTAALSLYEPGREEGMDPFEYCANEAEENAELIEQMRGIYPGDPYGALGRDANKMRRLAKSIRQLRPAPGAKP